MFDSCDFPPNTQVRPTSYQIYLGSTAQ
jgi:hypothetical protein